MPDGTSRRLRRVTERRGSEQPEGQGGDDRGKQRGRDKAQWADRLTVEVLAQDGYAGGVGRVGDDRQATARDGAIVSFATTEG